MSFAFDLQTVLTLVMGFVVAVLFVRIRPRGLLAIALTALPVLGVALTQIFC